MRLRLIVCVACLLGASTGAAVARADAPRPSVAVQLTRLTRGSLPRTIVAYGAVRAAPGASETVMAPASASVTAVYVRGGQEVSRGARLVELVPSPRSTAAFAQARAALRVAGDLVARSHKLLAQHLATAQQLADAEKSEADARANLKALRAQGAGGPTVLRAPFRAVVARLSATPGAIVAEGAPLLELARPRGLVLEVGLQPMRAASVKAGDAARIRLIGAHRELPGKVLLRAAVVDAASGLVPVEIGLARGHFMLGEAARVAITTGELRGFVVPHDAILVDDGGHPYVVQAAQTKARKVPVTIVGSQGERDVIAGRKLDPSQPLVLTGNYQLQDGMTLRVAKPEAQGGR